MQVNLKKAAELSRALIAASKAIQPKTQVKISVFTTGEVNETVRSGRENLLSEVTRALDLLDSGYAMRSLISAANCENAIDAMLTEVAKLDEQIARLGEIEKVIYTDDPMSPDDMEAVERRVEVARAEATNPSEGRRFSYTNSVDVGTVSTDDRAEVSRRIAALKRQRIAAKDKITLANFTHQITLPGGIETLLRKEGLID